MLASPASCIAPHQEVAGAAGAVTSEHPAGAIGAVRCGGEPDHQNARARVAESRHRPRPVGVVAVRAPS